ncbi:hypothetical protein JCM21900_000267 [Sporobolomyces salmonicolor]
MTRIGRKAKEDYLGLRLPLPLHHLFDPEGFPLAQFALLLPPTPPSSPPLLSARRASVALQGPPFRHTSPSSPSVPMTPEIALQLPPRTPPFVSPFPSPVAAVSAQLSEVFAEGSFKHFKSEHDVGAKEEAYSHRPALLRESVQPRTFSHTLSSSTDSSFSAFSFQSTASTFSTAPTTPALTPVSGLSSFSSFDLDGDLPNSPSSVGAAFHPNHPRLRGFAERCSNTVDAYTAVLDVEGAGEREGGCGVDSSASRPPWATVCTWSPKYEDEETTSDEDGDAGRL